MPEYCRCHEPLPYPDDPPQVEVYCAGCGYPIRRQRLTRTRRRRATRTEQQARYLDCGPVAWDNQ